MFAKWLAGGVEDSCVGGWMDGCWTGDEKMNEKRLAGWQEGGWVDD